MLDTQKEIDGDVLAVGLIDAVPTLLEILCDTSGMGFAAVARVSACNWTACAVLDRIGFGLKAGSQLDLSSTLCCESRAQRQTIVIDHVAEDPIYRDHHTPKIYGFQSYISVPIILKNGDYFGNLCGIDPKPLVISDPKISSLFSRFAQLIASQLDLKKVSISSYATLINEQALQEMRDLFDCVLGRDLRQPLATLDSAIDQLAPTECTELRAASRHMSLLIDEALDFSLARFGKGLPTNIQATEHVAAALNETIDEFRREQSQARLISNIVVNSVVQCDLGRLKQLLTILLNEAFHLSAPLGPISATAVLNAGKLIIEVWNGGECIAAEDRDKVFAPSWRRGLYLCAQIAQAHGGSARVLSREGEGTLLTVEIPA